MERHFKFKEQCKTCAHHIKCITRDKCKGCTNRRTDQAVFTCYCAENAGKKENICPRYIKEGG